MIELLVLMVGAMPFIIGLLALRKMRKRNDTGSDDMPPPPDPQPPLPLLPSTPETRRSHRHRPVMTDRGPAPKARVAAPGWSHRVRC